MTAPVQELPEPQADTCMGEAAVAANPMKKKKRAGPKSRTSPYVGVSQYKRTGRWEAHLWDSGDGPTSKGRQLHLGSFRTAMQAAKAYDRLALVLKGSDADINFPSALYDLDPLYVRLTQLSSKKSMVMAIRATQDQDEEETTLQQQQGADGAAGAEHQHPDAGFGPATPIAAVDLPVTPAQSAGLVQQAAGDSQKPVDQGGAEAEEEPVAVVASAGVKGWPGRSRGRVLRTVRRVGQEAEGKGRREEVGRGAVRRSSRIAAAAAAEAEAAAEAPEAADAALARTAPASSLSPASGQSHAGSQGPAPRQPRISPGASCSVGPAAAPADAGEDSAASVEEKAWVASTGRSRHALRSLGRQAGRPKARFAAGGLQELESGDSSDHRKRKVDGSCQEAAQGVKIKLQKRGSPAPAAAGSEPAPPLAAPPPSPSPEPTTSGPSAEPCLAPVDQRSKAGGGGALRPGSLGKGTITRRALGPAGPGKGSAGEGPQGQMGLGQGQSAAPALGPGGLGLGLTAGGPLGPAGLAGRAQALGPPMPSPGVLSSALAHHSRGREPSQLIGPSDLSSMAAAAHSTRERAGPCKQEAAGATAAAFNVQPPQLSQGAPPGSEAPLQLTWDQWGSLAAQQAAPVSAASPTGTSAAPAPAAIALPASFTQAAPAQLPGTSPTPALFPGTPPMPAFSPTGAPGPSYLHLPGQQLSVLLQPLGMPWDFSGELQAPAWAGGKADFGAAAAAGGARAGGRGPGGRIAWQQTPVQQLLGQAQEEQAAQHRGRGVAAVGHQQQVPSGAAAAEAEAIYAQLVNMLCYQLQQQQQQQQQQQKAQDESAAAAAAPGVHVSDAELSACPGCLASISGLLNVSPAAVPNGVVDSAHAPGFPAGAMNVLGRKKAKGQAPARRSSFSGQPAVTPAAAAADSVDVPPQSPAAAEAEAALSDQMCHTPLTLPLVTTSIALGGALEQTGQRQSSSGDVQRPGAEVQSPGLLCGTAALSSHWVDSELWGPVGGPGEEGLLLGGVGDWDRLLTEEQEQRMEEREEMDMMVQMMLD